MLGVMSGSIPEGMADEIRDNVNRMVTEISDSPAGGGGLDGEDAYERHVVALVGHLAQHQELDPFDAITGIVMGGVTTGNLVAHNEGRSLLYNVLFEAVRPVMSRDIVQALVDDYLMVASNQEGAPNDQEYTSFVKMGVSTRNYEDSPYGVSVVHRTQEIANEDPVLAAALELLVSAFHYRLHPGQYKGVKMFPAESIDRLETALLFLIANFADLASQTESDE